METNQNSQKQDEEIKQNILKMLIKEKPQTTQELVRLIQNRTALSIKQIEHLIIELETEEKLTFSQKPTHPSSTISAHLRSKDGLWFWIIIVTSLIATAAIFLAPANIYASLIRIVLALFFEFFLPGYVLIRIIYPTQLPFKQKSQTIDITVRIALSIGASLVFQILLGMVLNFLPFGISLISVTMSLLVLTVFLAAIALMRIYLNNVPLESTKNNE